MIVRPDAMSASSAPSTRPLKHCEMKLAQLTTPPSAPTSMNDPCRRRPDRQSVKLRRSQASQPEHAGFPVHSRRNEGLPHALESGEGVRSGVIAELAAEGVW